MTEKIGVLVIGGASKGLGKALAQHAAQEGFSVALLGRSRAELIKLANDIQETSTKKITYHQVDLSDDIATQLVFDQIIEQHEKIEVLVNCAATWTGGKGILDLSKELIQHSFEANFYTAFNPIKSLISLPQDNKVFPLKIINIGATASLRGSANMSSFATAKSALRVFSESLARELGPKNIHVAHLIIDGLIGNERTFALNPDVPKNKFINMESIAKSILHVISQEPSCWTFEWDIRPYSEKW